MSFVSPDHLIIFLAFVQQMTTYTEPSRPEVDAVPVNIAPRRPRILLAASGSVAAIKFGNLVRSFCEWAEVKAVATKASLHFIDRAALPKGVYLYTDDDEWASWTKLGDNVLHIELRRWADVMVIAPLSANTLAKVICLATLKKLSFRFQFLLAHK